MHPIIIKIGQRFRFFESISMPDFSIAEGTVVSIGYVLNHMLGEQTLMLVTKGPDAKVLTVPRHIVSLHSFPV